MLDFSKWVAMWDAFDRMGEAVSGSPASICQGIGLTLMMVFGFVGLIAVAVIGGGGDDPEESPFFCSTMAIAYGIPTSKEYRRKSVIQEANPHFLPMPDARKYRHSQLPN